MPAYAHQEGGDWHQKADFVRPDREPWNVSPASPETREEIRAYLEDIGASALAAANQFVDPATANEVYEDMAMRVYEDVTSELYPLHVAILRQQYRELGLRTFGYAVSADGQFEQIKAS
jgi:hypothetical protein